MLRNPTVWWMASILFSIVNLGGAVFAAVQGEPMHAGTHAGLTVLGAYLLWRLAPRRGPTY